MAKIKAKLASMGVTLPDPNHICAGVTLRFPWIGRRDDRVFVFGHVALIDDGSRIKPLG